MIPEDAHNIEIRKEYEKIGNKFDPKFGMFSAIPYILWLEDVIKFEREKVKELSALIKEL
jgi:hypothetical protein